jgi:glycosyltransferase involved in cell wall biosynthesis
LNILLINYEYPPLGGGAATATQALANELHRLGHSVTVLTSGIANQVGETSEAGIAVARLPSSRATLDRSTSYEKASYVMHAAVALPRLLRRFKPDGCIVFFSMPCGPLGRIARVLSSAPYVVSLRGGDVPGTEAALGRVHMALTPIRRWVLRGAAAVVANSEGLRAMSAKADPVPVTVIHNGVDTDTFLPGSGAKRPECNFAFVGRLNTQKNVLLLLSAAEQLKRDVAIPFHLTIVGDGPLAAELRAEAESRGLSAVVDWRPWIARASMPSCLASMDCLVNPSLYEGLPNSVLEAMACGLPVIASDVVGNADLVAHERTGLLFQGGNKLALADAMRRVLEDRETASAWGRAGRAIAEKEYSWSAAASAYAAIFRPAGVEAA